jgi:hypothetical protein
MLNKLFSGKKSKDGFYVQLDEASEAKSDNGSNGKKAANTVVEKPKAEAVVDNKKSESEPVKAVVEAKENGKVKAAKSKSKSKAEVAPVAPAPKKSEEYEPPFWVKAMNANTSNGNGKAASSVESFAENNLMPLNRSRRRPGPSLNPFMDMARQVKNSKF